MRRNRSVLALLGGLAGIFVACNQPAAPDESASQATSAESQAPKKLTLQNDIDKWSYSIGVDIAKTLKEQGTNLDFELIQRGMSDVLADRDLPLSGQEMSQSLRDYQKNMQEKKKKREQEMAKKNKEEGEAFLAKNGKRPGVVTLPSGLQYEVLREGTGSQPKASDSVVTHYRGTLLDGTEFDSSYNRDKPATFRVQRVIAGWTEALQLMKVGAKWKLYVPSELAYGPRRTGPIITPNSTLIFEIELLNIEKSK